jgi:hypothetical protein
MPVWQPAPFHHHDVTRYRGCTGCTEPRPARPLSPLHEVRHENSNLWWSSRSLNALTPRARLRSEHRRLARRSRASCATSPFGNAAVPSGEQILSLFEMNAAIRIELDGFVQQALLAAPSASSYQQCVLHRPFSPIIVSFVRPRITCMIQGRFRAHCSITFISSWVI